MHDLDLFNAWLTICCCDSAVAVRIHRVILWWFCPANDGAVFVKCGDNPNTAFVVAFTLDKVAYFKLWKFLWAVFRKGHVCLNSAQI